MKKRKRLGCWSKKAVKKKSERQSYIALSLFPGASEREKKIRSCERKTWGLLKAFPSILRKKKRQTDGKEGNMFWEPEGPLPEKKRTWGQNENIKHMELGNITLSKQKRNVVRGKTVEKRCHFFHSLKPHSRKEKSRRYSGRETGRLEETFVQFKAERDPQKKWECNGGF